VYIHVTISTTGETESPTGKIDSPIGESEENQKTKLEVERKGTISRF
jgi:hypothetical protein